ncbi:MAG TPA: polysaccharide pyruvyl transferase CsaB [bacterium]|nr:polysaccharide pyruvyl transferase CsaB [bacterium]
MSRVVLSGYYGFKNLGDEAVLAATAGELRRRCPGVEITVLSASPAETSRLHGVRGVSRRNPGEILRVLRGCDLFLSGGGSLFQDATSWRSPWYYLSILALARRLARRTAVYAQGIEPFRRASTRKAVSFLLNQVDLVTVRDAASQAVLAEIGVRRPRVVLSADPSLLLTPEWSASAEAEKAGWGDGVVFGLALRQWGRGEAVRAAADAARIIAARRGVKWVLLPMHLPGDLAVAETLAAHIGPGAIVLRTPMGPREMLALVGSLDLLVGMRLHALLFAAAQGVPIVPLAYDPKVEALARDLGESVPVHAARLSSRDLARSIEAAADDRTRRRAHLLAAVGVLRERAMLAPRLAVDLLQ